MCLKPLNRRVPILNRIDGPGARRKRKKDEEQLMVSAAPRLGDAGRCPMPRLATPPGETHSRSRMERRPTGAQSNKEGMER